MPSIVGNVKILSVGTGAIVQFGDCLTMAPNSSSKTFAGSGSFNTGDFPRTFTGVNNTNTADQDLVDQNQPKVAGGAVV